MTRLAVSVITAGSFKPMFALTPPPPPSLRVRNLVRSPAISTPIPSSNLRALRPLQ